MALEFLHRFGDRLDVDKRAVSNDCSNAAWRARANYAWSPAVFRQTAVDDVILRVLLALGRFSPREPPSLSRPAVPSRISSAAV